jgi:drug/metabolite transporter (DMT)-like permease
MKIKDIATTYLILALMLGALLPVMLKIGSQSGASTYEYLMLASLVALPVSFGYLLARKKTNRLVDSMKNAKEFVFIAILGVLDYGLLEYGLTYAEKYITTSLATVVYRSYPLLMLIFLPVMLRERISKYQVVALSLGLVGIYIAITGASIAAIGTVNLIIVGLVVAIALASAYVFVAIKKYSFEMDVAIFVFNLGTFVFFAALFFAAGAPLSPLNTTSILTILYIGIVYNVLTGLMYFSALRMIKTTFMTNIYFLSPFVTFIFSWFILGEKIYLYYIAIAVLVSAGILIQKLDKKGGTYLQKSKSDKHTIHDVTSAFVNTNVPLIYNAIRTGGRVLAVKLDSEYYNTLATLERSVEVEKEKVLLYTSNCKKFINDQQHEFVKDVMGLNDNEFFIMCAGEPTASENTLLDTLYTHDKNST